MNTHIRTYINGKLEPEQRPEQPPTPEQRRRKNHRALALKLSRLFKIPFDQLMAMSHEELLLFSKRMYKSSRERFGSAPQPSLKEPVK